MAERILYRSNEIIIRSRLGVNPKGWNSNQHFSVPERIDSDLCPFRPIILLVPPKILGTHEAVTDEGLKDIDFSNGWKGPAIAVAPFDKLTLARLLLGFKDKPGVFKKLSYGSLFNLDGHHRHYKALSELNLVPVQVFPYGFDKRVVLDTWHEDGQVLDRKIILKMAKDPNSVADAKRTKFGAEGEDGNIYRLSSLQPDVIIPRSVLI